MDRPEQPVKKTREEAPPGRETPEKNWPEQAEFPRRLSPQEKGTEPEEEEEEKHPGRKRLLWIGGGAIAVIVIVIAVFWWLHSRQFESTDDAFLDAHSVSIAPKVASYVASVPVTDNQRVRQGQVLVQLDARDLDAALAQAQANLVAAQAEENRTRVALARYRSMRPGAVSEQDRTNAEADAKVATARVAQNQTAVHEAQLQRSYATITAPVNGYVTNKSVEAGAYVQVGQTVMTVVPENVYVTANFKETQLTRVRPGQPVEIHIDAFPQYKLKGHVDSIQSGTGAQFSLLPPENATGNYVKVVQRVPVKIVFDEKPPEQIVLAPGMSVVPKVKVR